jgi:two-component system, response regulator YesN
MSDLLTRQIKVLVADDSQIVRDGLTVLLSEMPGVDDVLLAHNGSEALDVLQMVRPEVLIMDLRLPGVSGWEVLEQMRHEGLDPLVIVLSNFPFFPYRKKCRALEVDFFLDKSTEIEKLLSILREFVHRQNGIPLQAPPQWPSPPSPPPVN